MFSRNEPEHINDDPAFEVRETGRWRLFRWFVYPFVAFCAATVVVWALSGKPDTEPQVIKGSSTPDRAQPADDSNRVRHQDQPIYERLAAGSETDRGQELLPGAEKPMSRAELAAKVGSPAPVAAVPSAPGGHQSAALPPAATPPTPAVKPPVTTRAPASNTQPNFRIQIASVANEDQAQAEWGRISSRHPDLLGRLEGYYPSFTSSGGQSYVRVQAGPLVDKALAELLCSQLKARKVDCFVIEP
ncbi:MAG: SPOR domain-containing protein [Alphaproteobacteria bacterium]